ncbi:MAG: prephenate dehydrogenase [Saprospiraceae bacterium]|nr:prephenate dehydrogenase [Saprospiraceae bacterium]
MKITVIGLGLIGGSVALDLKSQLNVIVHGVDNSESHRIQAKELELVHQITDLNEGVKGADIIVIAIPVDKTEKLLSEILDRIEKHTVVIDMGSTKSKICHTVREHKNRGQFVAAHPLAGTEFSGPSAAIKGLFQNRRNIICEAEKSDPDALELALKFFKSLGLTTRFMDPEDHDRHLAYVSHLSHVSSFILGQTVLDIEKDEKEIFNLAGTGFASTVRLAKSNPITWSAIFMKNKNNLIKALDSYIENLKAFRDLLEREDTKGCEQIMTYSNSLKNILKS